MIRDNDRSIGAGRLTTRFAATVILAASMAGAATLRGRVVGVADGDTITVLDAGHKSWKIRFAGIDAPEKAQPFGKVSKRNLSGLVFGRDVVVEHDKIDRWGRVVGKVTVDARDAGLEQVRAGLAWHYKAYENEQSVEDRRLHETAEQTARAAKIGLWADPDAVPPWVFRRRKNGEGSAPILPRNRSRPKRRRVREMGSVLPSWGLIPSMRTS